MNRDLVLLLASEIRKILELSETKPYKISDGDYRYVQ